jgi:hypothetical protein
LNDLPKSLRASPASRLALASATDAALASAAPEGFHALLKHLETRVHEVERGKAFAQVGA